VHPDRLRRRRARHGEQNGYSSELFHYGACSFFNSKIFTYEAGIGFHIRWSQGRYQADFVMRTLL